MLGAFPLLAAAVPGSVAKMTLAMHKVCELYECTVAGDRWAEPGLVGTLRLDIFLGERNITSKFQELL